MHYGTPLIRRTVPLALALSSPSNPALTLIDTLSKYSHDTDLSVALSAIWALGIIGCGTNNAKLLQNLRQLAVYYAKEGDCLFAVRVSMGLVSMGKGTLGLGVWYGNTGGNSGSGSGGVMCRGALAGLLSVFVAMLDAKSCKCFFSLCL
jgi:26S proteasome regulatory subunit N1